MSSQLRVRRQLFILLLSIFVGTIGHGILSPLVPQLFTGKLALFPSASYVVYGLLVAIFPLAQFCSAFLLSGISDRVGRKRILLLSLWGTAAGYVLFIMGLATRNLSLLFIGRAIDGVTGGNISITQAAVADLTSKQERTSKISLVGGAFGLGIVIGPVLGGTLASTLTVSSPFMVAGAVSVINAVLVWAFLPDLPAASRDTSALWQELGEKLREYAHVLRIRNLLGASFLYNCAMTGFNSFFAIYLVMRFHFSAEMVGFFYMYIGILYALNQFVIVPRVSRHWQSISILSFTTVGLGVILFSYAGIYYWPLLVPAALLITVLNGLSQTNFAGGLSTLGTHDEQGKLLGLNSSMFALAQTIVPPLVGLGTGILGASFPMVLGSALMFMAALLVLPLQERLRHRELALERTTTD